MPLVFGDIRSVEIGSISTRKLDAPIQLDSYQEEELTGLLDTWMNQVNMHKCSLEKQILLLDQNKSKTPEEIEREYLLFDEMSCWMEERIIAECPPVGSGIPGKGCDRFELAFSFCPVGCVASWTPPATVEMHRPLLVLNVHPVHRTASEKVAGLHAQLEGEVPDSMVKLPLVQQQSSKVHAVAQWDPSVHENRAM